MAQSPNINRRDFVKAAGVAAAATRLEGAPAIQTVKAANNVVQYGVIGTGGRGQYLLRHMNTLDGCRCVAVCDVYQPNMEAGIKASRDKPRGYLDYRELLARTDVDAVIICTPLYTHFPITRDALLAGKHVFCEKSLVFKPEEIHALRALCKERPRQVLQVGLQRRYSKFYQTARQMIEKGILGKVTHVYAQWHRNPGWRMRKAPDPKMHREWNWRLFREYSGGLTAELGSHQFDVASWMFGAEPEFVVGVGGIDTHQDGRDVYDNIQLIFTYPGGRKLMYSSISTNKHLAIFQGTRTEFGEIIMGTEGTIEITVGTDEEPALGLWYYEPGPPKVEKAAGVKEKPVIAGATLVATGKGQIGLPLLFERDQITGRESFLARELKYARLWLYKRGIMVPEEDRNPVDVQMEEFFECCRTGARPKADLEIGLADSTAVILANLAMDEGRRVYFHEIEKMGRTPEPKGRKA